MLLSKLKVGLVMVLIALGISVALMTHSALATPQVEVARNDVGEKSTTKAIQNDLPLPRLEPKIRLTLKGHTHKIFSEAFSPDGKTLASGSYDKTVKLWDVATGQERASLKGHQHWVTSVAYAPDGKTLASGSLDSTIRLWDLATGQEQASLKGHAGLVQSVAFSPDGKTLASGSGDTTVKLWDVATLKERASLQGNARYVFAVSFSPDGKTLASGGGDTTVKLWDVTTLKEQAPLQGHAHNILSVAFSPDGKTLASGSADKTVKLWDVITGKERASLQGHTNFVYGVAFSPNGKTLASGSLDKTVKLWDVATGKEQASLKGHEQWVTSVAYSPDGSTLASGSVDRTVKLWNIPASNQADNQGKDTQSARWSSQDLDRFWTRLAGDDAAQAFQAINMLVEEPRQAIAFMKQRLRPAAEPTAEQHQQAARILPDLDSKEFAVRQKARDELEKLGAMAEKVLRAKLAEQPSPSLEVRRQIERLLTRIEQLSPESIRALRTVEVLEHIGSPEAKQVLEMLATGAERSRLTTEARASLARLSKRVAADK